MNKQRPRLTSRVRNGLRTLAGFVEAGSCADILGCEYNTATPDQKRDWDDIEQACEWIWGLKPEKEMAGE